MSFVRPDATEGLEDIAKLAGDGGNWEDWKLRVYLIDCKRTGDGDTATVLLTSQGIHHKKIGVSYFMILEPGRAIARDRFVHGQFEEHHAHTGTASQLVYYTLTDSFKTAVIPFACNQDQKQGPPPEKLGYPYTLMDKQFLMKILELDRDAESALYEVQKRQLRLNEYYEDSKINNKFIWDEQVHRRLKEDMDREHEKFVNLNRERYMPLREMILSRFPGKYPSTRELRMDELNPEHRQLRRINRVMEMERSSAEQKSRRKQRELFEPFRYMIAPSKTLAHFNIIRDDPDISSGELKELTDIYDRFSRGDDQRRILECRLAEAERDYAINPARSGYYKIMASASAMAAFTGYVIGSRDVGLGIAATGLMVGLLEWSISCANQKKHGYPTSLLGTIRDMMGWKRYRP